MSRGTRQLRLTGRGLGNLLRGPQRDGRVFGVGAAKTGTHTIGEMFADRVPSAHELDAERLIRLVLDDGPGSPALRRHLLWRDRWRGLQIDASQVNIYLIPDLLALFPEARFILTVRPPALWLRSIVDDSLRRDTSAIWHRFRDFRFGAQASAQGPESVLAKAGLYTIDGYLSYWARAVTEVTTRVPHEALLILPTGDIGARAAAIARFARVPDPDHPPVQTHVFGNPVRSGVLAQLPPAYLAGRIEAVAGPVARAVLPGWTVEADLATALADPPPPGQAR